MALDMLIRRDIHSLFDTGYVTVTPDLNFDASFKPRQMRFLLSIKTVFPRPGARAWCDDQREVHRQIFESDYQT